MLLQQEAEVETKRNWLAKWCSTSVEGLDVIQGLVNGVHPLASLFQNCAGTEHCSVGLHVLDGETGDIRCVCLHTFLRDLMKEPPHYNQYILLHTM